MEALIIGAAIIIGFMILRSGGLLTGSPTSTIMNPATTTPSTATGAGISSNLAQAANASSAYSSQVLANSQQGSNQGINSLIGIGSTIAGGTIGEIGSIAATGALSATGLATAGVGVVVGIATMLWQQHEVRMKDATDENSAWNIIYPDWASAIQQILLAFNSGQISASTCAAEFESLRALVYQDAQKFQNKPGIAWNSTVGLTNSQTIWQTPCTKACTIGCCLFNGVVGPNTMRAVALVSGQPVAVFGTGSQQMVTTNSFTVPSISVNTTYGFQGAPAFTMSIA